MPTEKKINARYQQKHDIEAHWKQATNFIPKAGEIIIYDADEVHDSARIKIGDGSTKVGDLPFVNSASSWNGSNLFEKMRPKDVKIDYATQSNGWRVNVTQTNGESYALYINDYECGVQNNYDKVISLDPAKATTLNIQKINGAHMAGDFIFDNVKLQPAVNTNCDFSNGTEGWTTHTDSVLEVVSDPTGDNRGNVLHVNNAAASQIILATQTLTIEPGREYELHYKVYGYKSPNKDGAIRVQFPYSTELVSQTCDTVSHMTLESRYARVSINEHLNMWHDVCVRFKHPSATTMSINFLNYRGGAGYFYIDDVCIVPAEVNLVANGGFDEDLGGWTYESWYYPYTITDGQLQTVTANIKPNTSPTTLCKMENVPLDTNSQYYRVSIDATRLTPSYQWQDYMTLGEADKYALTRDGAALIEKPKCGGPWTKSLEPNYVLRVSANIRNKRGSISGIELTTSIVSASKSKVILEVEKTGEVPIKIGEFEFEENSSFAEAVEPQVKYIPCLEDSNNFDVIYITLQLDGEIRTDFHSAENYLLGARVYGHSDAVDIADYPVTIDYFGKITCSSVSSERYYGVWDDGSLDWSVD